MSLSNKKLAISLTSSAIVLTGITTLLIFITPKPTDQTNDSTDVITPRSLISQPTSPVADESSLAIKSLSETYLSPHFGVGSYNKPTIDSIDILKDQTLQSKINQEYQSACNDILLKAQDYEQRSDAYAYTICDLSATIGDTLSMVTYMEVDYTGAVIFPDGFGNNGLRDDGIKVSLFSVPYHVTTKNYRLDTGEEIKFDDLFVADTDLTPILTKAAYEAVHCHMNSCGGGGVYAYADIPDIDTEVLRIIQALRNTKDIRFSFDELDINIWIEDYRLSIRMSEWYDKIAIFKRFKSSENLYTITPPTPQFIFSASTANHKNEFVSDNLFVRIGTYGESDDTPNPIIIKRNELIETVTNQAIDRVRNQRDIYLLDFQIYTYKQSNENYSLSISIACSLVQDSYEYCANLYKLPLDQPTKDSAANLVATAARDRGQFGHTLHINNATNDTGFWSGINGYNTDDSGFTSIAFYFDASGNPVTPTD